MQEILETNTYRKVLKDKILKMAMALFVKHGIKAVKMDDIAQELGISKRTLYEIYEDKEKLVFQGVVQYDKQKHELLDDFAREDHHVIDIILEAYRLKVKESRMVNPLFFEDILKYPDVANYIKEERERVREGFIKFMERGVKEGCFRADVDYGLVQQLFDAMGQHIMTNKLMKQHTVEELFTNMFLVLLRGICTERGLRLIEAAEPSKIQ